METKIIIINGLGGSGKSTFATLCKEYGALQYSGMLIKELSTIDFVKEVARFCGWDGSKTTNNRVFLHHLKTVLEEWDNIPAKKVLDEIALGPKDNALYFVNIREANSIDKFKEACNERGYKYITLVVNNPNIISNEVPRLIEEIQSYPYDVIITNDKDLFYLKQCANGFIESLVNGLM